MCVCDCVRLRDDVLVCSSGPSVHTRVHMSVHTRAGRGCRVGEHAANAQRVAV